MPDVKFHFIKSPAYQEHPCHGAFGGITPLGDNVFLAFYTERLPIPTATVHTVSDQGELGVEMRDRRESREGVVRIIQTGFYLDRDRAVSVRDWLDSKIKEMDEVNGNGNESSS